MVLAAKSDTGLPVALTKLVHRNVARKRVFYVFVVPSEIVKKFKITEKRKIKYQLEQDRLSLTVK